MGLLDLFSSAPMTMPDGTTREPGLGDRLQRALGNMKIGFGYGPMQMQMGGGNNDTQELIRKLLERETGGSGPKNPTPTSPVYAAPRRSALSLPEISLFQGLGSDDRISALTGR